MHNFLLPSPLQKVNLPELTQQQITLYIKRDELIHPIISGNKWRKLKYNILNCQKKGVDTLLTFGGAYSNHIAATAYACKIFGLNSIGIIRGTYVDENNATLLAAKQHGMQIVKVSKEEYNLRNSFVYWEELKSIYGDVYIVPEGGANFYGVNGCIDIVNEITLPFDYLVLPIGTGTTCAGCLLGIKNTTKIIGINIFKNYSTLEEEVISKINLVLNDEEESRAYKNSLTIIDGYAAGGYGKVNHQLVQEIETIERKTDIKFDHIYNGKAIVALFDLVKKNYFTPGSRVVFLHTGGLQGKIL